VSGHEQYKINKNNNISNFSKINSGICVGCYGEEEEVLEYIENYYFLNCSIYNNKLH
jgi:hypothetical protein